MPYKTEGPYFVNLDNPAPLSRTTQIARDTKYSDDGGKTPVPAYKRRKRKIHIRPGWIVALLLAAWLGWAYTTPGGPSARIRGWIDHTRGVVADASVNPDVRRSAEYFNSLYASQGSYPNLSDSAIQASPGFGLSETLVYCGPQRDRVAKPEFGRIGQPPAYGRPGSRKREQRARLPDQPCAPRALEAPEEISPPK